MTVLHLLHPAREAGWYWTLPPLALALIAAAGLAGAVRC